MENIIVGEFNTTGANTVNVDVVIKKWNHLWWLSEWKSNNTWLLIKYVRKDSSITDCKISIRHEQANELIDKLNLISENIWFAGGFSWRRREDMEHLEEWRSKKYERKYANQ